MHLESSFLIFICQISNPQNKWDVWIVYLVVVSVLNFEVGFWRVDVALWSSQSQQKFGFAKDNVYFVYLYMMHMYDTHTHTPCPPDWVWRLQCISSTVLELLFCNVNAWGGVLWVRKRQATA